MATLIRYVNTAAAGGGDGTTNGTGAGGTNAFATLAAAIAALPQTLTGITCTVADEFGNLTIALDIICTGTTADSGGQVAINSATWVTDTTHRLRIRGDTMHGPTYDTTKYHITSTQGFTGTIYLDTAINITIQDIQAENTTTFDNAPNALRGSTGGIWDLHLVRGFYRITATTGTPGGTCSAIQIDASQYLLQMQNVTATSTAGGDPTINLSGGGTTPFAIAYVYNGTFINSAAGGAFGFGFATTDTIRLINLLLQSPGGSAYGVGNQSATSTLNGISETILTNDTTSPTVGLRSKTCTFVNAAANNYHELVTDPSVGVGTNISADSYMPITTNGDGVVRVAPWDVGADQYTAASIGTYNIFVSGVNLAYINAGTQHTVLGGISKIATTYTPGQMIVANNNLIYCDANGTTRIIPGANQGASSYTPGCVRIVGTNLRWTGVDGNEYAAISIVS